MLKNAISGVLILMCSGCVGFQLREDIHADKQSSELDSKAEQAVLFPDTSSQPQCLGDTELPIEHSKKFVKIEDTELLAQTLGQPNAGKLCQGQVYQAKENTQVILFRAWNATNPNSQLGNWWAFKSPRGQTAQYRSDYEICYQWSPLDKLTHCTLKAGAKVVLGTGQSAVCSEYLTYPVSAKKQVYLADAKADLTDCRSYNGEFSWQAVISQ
jgi:hypothetical protein